jgi:hypothetical protein
VANLFFSLCDSGLNIDMLFRQNSQEIQSLSKHTQIHSWRGQKNKTKKKKENEEPRLPISNKSPIEK